MNVSVSYLTTDGSQAFATGTELRFDEDNLLCFQDDSSDTETLLFSFNGISFNSGSAAIVGDAAPHQQTLTIIAEENALQGLVALDDEHGDEIGRSLFFELRATTAGIVIADADGMPLVQWFDGPQSWWRRGKDLGQQLGFVLAGSGASARVLLVPTVRERLSPLAERINQS